MKLGVSLPGVQQIPGRVQAWERDLSGAEIVGAARAAESAGLAWVSCSDHVAVPVSRAATMGATWYDAGSTLAFVAGATAHIGLLAHVLVLPYRHPLLVAKQYGTLDRLSAGRVILGVGSGHLRAEFAVLGADFAVRGRVSDEYLQAIAAAWTEEVAHFGGDTVAYRDLLVSPRPLQRPRPPIWVGGNSRAAVRRAARYADGWVPWEVDRDGLPTVLATARSLRARAGRPAAFEVVAPLTLPAGTGVADAVALALRWREAGATAFHVGLPARSGEEWLDRIAWLGAEIAPRLAA